MPDNPQSEPSPTPNTAAENQQASQITPEMVKAIADKVYNMLLLDLKYENERLRFSSHRPVKIKGVR